MSDSRRLASELPVEDDGAPRTGLAGLLGQPELRRVVVGPTGERRQVLDEVEEGVADRRATGDLVLHAGDRTDGRGRVRPAQGAPQVLEQAAPAFRGQPAENRRELDVACSARELLARLALGRVRLVHDPVPDRRQDAALRDDISKEQRVVGDDHVGARGAAPHAVQVAEVGVEPAALARAVGLRR